MINQHLFFRQPRFTFSNITVDCESWERIEVLEHNKPGRARLSEKVETNLESESSEHRKESFAKVYENDEWGNERKSGPGSLLENSWTVIRVLNVLVEKIKKDLGKDRIMSVLSAILDKTPFLHFVVSWILLAVT